MILVSFWHVKRVYRAIGKFGRGFTGANESGDSSVDSSPRPFDIVYLKWDRCFKFLGTALAPCSQKG